MTTTKPKLFKRMSIAIGRRFSLFRGEDKVNLDSADISTPSCNDNHPIPHLPSSTSNVVQPSTDASQVIQDPSQHDSQILGPPEFRSPGLTYEALCAQLRVIICGRDDEKLDRLCAMVRDNTFGIFDSEVRGLCESAEIIFLCRMWLYKAFTAERNSAPIADLFSKLSGYGKILDQINLLFAAFIPNVNATKPMSEKKARKKIEKYKGQFKDMMTVLFRSAVHLDAAVRQIMHQELRKLPIVSPLQLFIIHIIVLLKQKHPLLAPRASQNAVLGGDFVQEPTSRSTTLPIGPTLATESSSSNDVVQFFDGQLVSEPPRRLSTMQLSSPPPNAPSTYYMESNTTSSGVGQVTVDNESRVVSHRASLSAGMLPQQELPLEDASPARAARRTRDSDKRHTSTDEHPSPRKSSARLPEAKKRKRSRRKRRHEEEDSDLDMPRHESSTRRAPTKKKGKQDSSSEEDTGDSESKSEAEESDLSSDEDRRQRRQRRDKRHLHHRDSARRRRSHRRRQSSNESDYDVNITSFHYRSRNSRTGISRSEFRELVNPSSIPLELLPRGQALAQVVDIIKAYNATSTSYYYAGPSRHQ
ncbi:hypothetical protein CVT24_010054 [Panaeolus cyanescens]|uniref:Uncharacterized protein n=1 Tax=Panaeolus cyanescens TaxID=181874 RepID=A0A409YW98_9AGAR|nr:hypothetical protein CVT24_010054 [Panaeolus cyanescens]